jgi:hypothetical protein
MITRVPGGKGYWSVELTTELHLKSLGEMNP